MHLRRSGQKPATAQMRDRTYLLEQIKQEKWSKSRQNGVINAIKFLYEHVLCYDRQKIDLPRPRKDQKLPNVFSTGEVKRILASVEKCEAPPYFVSGVWLWVAVEGSDSATDCRCKQQRGSDFH